MNIRFFLVWVIVSVLIGAYMYMTKKKEKRKIRGIIWKSLLSGALAATILAFIINGLNNFQGV